MNIVPIPTTAVMTSRRAAARPCAAYRLAALCLAWLVLMPAPAAVSVDAIGIPVSDLARARAFYTEVLAFTPEREYTLRGPAYEALYGLPNLDLRVARLRLGTEAVELLQFVRPAGRAAPADSRSNDRWFQHIAIIVSDMAAAHARLRAHDVRAISPAPQRLPDWNPQAGGIEAFYFRDPDGNALEILHFPPGKGEARWQVADGRLFLGIDHSAIVVADTQASLAYYRDALGLRVAGESDNHGPEQERLNAVAGAHLRITGLRAAAGPGIEFLHYLAPGGGRAMPADTRPNDRWHWQIVLRSDDFESTAARLRAAPQCAECSAAVTIADETAGYRRARLLRDPDGHATLLTAAQDRNAGPAGPLATGR